tara:strand:- start:339 stop:587 length:249 start_codon:yes stop_codon:yes gene_type:complete
VTQILTQSRKNKRNKMYYKTYIELITFCKHLSIRQLIDYKNAVKEMKNREFLIACEVLEIRLSKKHKAYIRKQLNLKYDKNI